MTTTEADGAYAFDELLWGTYAIREMLPADDGEGEDPLVGVLDDLFGDTDLLPEMPGAYYDYGGLAPLLWGRTFVGDDHKGFPPPAGTDDIWPTIIQGEMDVPSDAFFSDLLEGTRQIVSAGPPAGADHSGPLGVSIIVDMLGSDLPAGTSGLEYKFAAVPPPPFVPALPRSPVALAPSTNALVPADGLVDPASGFGPGLNLPDPAATGGVAVEEGTARLGGHGFPHLDGCVPAENEEGIAGVPLTPTGVTAGGRMLSPPTTADGGAYTFEAPLAGHRVEARPRPQGFLDGGHLLGTIDGSTAGAIADEGFASIALPAGDAGRDYRFAAVRPAALRGVVWAADKEFEDEPGTFSVVGKAGVTVDLTGTDHQDLAVSRTTTSDAEGRYHFEGLYPGEYAVRVATPRGFRAVEARPGSKGGMAKTRRQIDTIRLNPSDEGSEYEFYYEGTGQVAGRVAGRPGPMSRTVGMGEVVVVLTGTARDGRAVERTTTTDARGKYLFHALPPGTYRVEVRADPDQGAWAKSPAQVNGKATGVPVDDAVAVEGIPLGADGRATGLDFTAGGAAE